MARLAAGDTSPPPSAKLMMLGDEGTLLRRRDARCQRPARQLRGDLDWIVMTMELEHQPKKTATGVTTRWHLANEPVVARPRSARYRIRKFVRRIGLALSLQVRVSVAILASAIWLLSVSCVP
jgi:hypothetical protein